MSKKVNTDKQSSSFESKEMPAKYGLDGSGRPAATYGNYSECETPEIGNAEPNPYK